MHITLTPAQHARLAKSQSGRGLPQNFDPAQWVDHPLNLDIYVTKGRGKYAGQGGGWTDMVSTLWGHVPDSIKNMIKSEAKSKAKEALGTATDKVADYAKSKGASSELVDMAASAAKSRAGGEIDKHIGKGLRAVGSGKCGGGRWAAASAAGAGFGSAARGPRASVCAAGASRLSARGSAAPFALPSRK